MTELTVSLTDNLAEEIGLAVLLMPEALERLLREAVAPSGARELWTDREIAIIASTQHPSTRHDHLRDHPA